MYKKTLAELSQALHNKEFSSEELTRTLLKRCESLNPTLNCFISLTPEHAISQAKTADTKLQNGTAGPLTGVPIAHKDIFC
ncbi:MAG: amidase family protein, partial [Gammaproteobacteria bacterium]